MTAVLDSPASARDRRVRHDPRTCPECLAPFQPVDARQIFCSQPHRRAWNNRWVTRGAVVAPLAAVARVTRNGTRGTGPGARIYGAKAARDMDALLARWRAEDKGAGRMAWEDWLQLRYVTGFDPL